jgi:aminomethyltransferase
MRILCESPAGKTNAERVEAFYRRECGATRQKLDFTDLKSRKSAKGFAADRIDGDEFALRAKRGAHYNHGPIFRAFCYVGAALPIGTALHDRTIKLCESLNFREWSGYYAASVYEMHHEHEYNAIRNAAALIDVTPLFKYRITGKDATKFVNRVITRDINSVSVGQVIYCCWCDEQGKVIDDGTISRLEENVYRWTAADPSMRWFHQNALGLDVQIEDISDQVAALALQGPTSGRLLKQITDADITNLKYFRVTHGKIASVEVDISRTGYTGDLGYEIWIPWNDAPKVWDALVEAGRQFDLHAAGMLALDVARVEAGLILIEVDYFSSKKALIESQKYSPYEIGLGRLVDLKKEYFIGRAALEEENRLKPKRLLMGLDINWDDVERLYDAIGLAPQVPGTTSRVPVPVYRGGLQVGKATSTTWSPTLKKMIALASIKREHAAAGTELQMELTVEAVRHKVRATTRELPFLNPARKTATPVT